MLDAPSPALETRVRMARRLLFAGLLVLAAAVGLSQIEAVRQAATGVLASTAVLGLVVGFAARQTLANAVAGILLAITQPIRIGDDVKFQESEGTVADMTLTYTYIDTTEGERMVVPNELLATGVIFNRTLHGGGPSPG